MGGKFMFILFNMLTVVGFGLQCYFWFGEEADPYIGGYISLWTSFMFIMTMVFVQHPTGSTVSASKNDDSITVDYTLIGGRSW